MRTVEQEALNLATRLGRSRLRDNVASGVVQRQAATLEPLAPPTPERAPLLMVSGLGFLALAALILWLLIGSGCGPSAKPPIAERTSTAGGAADEPVPGAGRDPLALSAPGPAAELLDALDTIEARADRLVAGRVLALDAASAAPGACVVGVATIAFRPGEVLARCRTTPNVGVRRVQ